MFRPKMRIAFGAVVVGLLCAACGSATKTVTTTSTTVPSSVHTTAKPTKADFIAKADAICAATEAKSKPIIVKVEAIANAESPHTSAELSKAVLDEVALEREAFAKLRQVPEPEGDSGILNQWFVALEEKATDEKHVAEDIAKEDESAVAAARSDAETAKAREHGISEGYGLHCGKKAS